MTASPLTVLKLGSSVLSREQDLPLAVHEVYRYLRRGDQVLVVVSAIGRTTDTLLDDARQLVEEPRPDALANLLATGEARAAALFGIALDRAGVPNRCLSHHEAGLIARGEALDAELESLDGEAIEAAFETARVVVLPGFVGRRACGRTATFGRGGSDLTAVFAAATLGASRCRLVKDVAGLAERDPALPGEAPRFFRSVSYVDALRLGGDLIQDKALHFARSRDLQFEIGALGRDDATLVGVSSSELSAATPVRPLRVILLGLGTVGRGVYDRLTELPERFEVVGALVRDRSRHLEAGFPGHLLHDDADLIFETPADVVVELVGGVVEAETLVRRALEAGCDVVSANKALLATQGEELESLAAARGSRLLYSASVAGALPALELLRDPDHRLGLVEVEGVLNGTTNFVLDRVRRGEDFDRAVDEAVARGFAESDPSLDLDGRDPTQKLALLSRAAFGRAPSPDRTRTRGLHRDEVEELDRDLPSGGRLRHLARLTVDVNGPRATIAPIAVTADHPAAGIRDEENLLILRYRDGRTLQLAGKGAGRWPTTESVLGDLLEIAAARGAAIREEI